MLVIIIILVYNGELFLSKLKYLVTVTYKAEINAGRTQDLSSIA